MTESIVAWPDMWHDMTPCLACARISCCFSLLSWECGEGSHSKIRTLWVGRSLQLDMRRGWEPIWSVKTTCGVVSVTDISLSVWQCQCHDNLKEQWSCGHGDSSPNHAAPQSACSLCVLKVFLSCAAIQTRVFWRADAQDCSSHMHSWLLPKQGVATTFAFPFSACRPKDAFMQTLTNISTTQVHCKLKFFLRENCANTATSSTWAYEQEECATLATTSIFKLYFFFPLVQKLILISRFSCHWHWIKWPIRLPLFVFLFPCVLM